MPVIALPWLTPALAWGLGALGTGLSTLGIIKNKDDIKDGISYLGNSVSNGIQKGIRYWSDAMSPKEPSPNPNYDVATGRPIAVADATRVAMPLFRYQTPPRPFGATRSVRYDVDAGPIPFPQQARSPEKPIQLRPGTVMGSRVMRTDSGEASSSTSAAGSSTGTGTASPAPASPGPKRNDSTNNKKGFKEKQKKVLNRLKTGYGNTLIGLEYGLGFSVPVGSAAYGIYKWMQPEKTRMDSTLDNQLRQVEELNKAAQINENQKKIDAILKQIQSGSSQTQQVDSGYVAPEQYVAPTDMLDF